MLITYWATKGGSGATVTSAVHALVAASHGPTLLVDLDGDLPDALGVPQPDAGIADWMDAGSSVPADALDRLSVRVADDLHLLARGRGPLDAGRADVLAGLLAATPRTVVVDGGTRPGPAATCVARASTRSVLVTRACYLAVQRCRGDALHPTDVVLVREPGRALGPPEVVAALGVAACHVVPHELAVAAAVDAGLLRARVPARVRRAVSRGPAA